MIIFTDLLLYTDYSKELTMYFLLANSIVLKRHVIQKLWQCYFENDFMTYYEDSFTIEIVITIFSNVLSS